MYNKFYGFSEKPFEITPDPRFLYLTPTHRELLATMIDGIKNRRGLISLTGEAGTGKTTLIYSLLHSLDEKVKTIYIFHSTFSFKELSKIVLSKLGFGTSKESATTLPHRLAERLALIPSDETIAIIIDEAHNLSEEVMQELRIFLDLKSKVVQTVLVGQPQLEDKFNSQRLRELKQSLGIRCQIYALNEEESREYIDHRIRLVGGRTETFSSEALSMICLHAKGLPRTINILCDNALLMGSNLSIKEIGADVIGEVLRNLEGPGSEKIIPSSVSKVLKKPRLPLNRLNLSLKKVSLVVASLLCLGGLIFLVQGTLQQRATHIWNGESSKSPPDHELSSGSPSSKQKGEKILKRETPHAIGGREPISPEFTQTGALPSPSLSFQTDLDKPREVAVEEGHTLFYLAQRYYRVTNTTLVDLILDFNPEITNAHLIKVNQKIKMPQVREERLIMQSGNGTCKIHVGTFQDAGEAGVYSNEPALKGKEIEVLPRKISPRDTWYRVVVGGFDNKDQALRVIRLLKERGLLPCFGGT